MSEEVVRRAVDAFMTRDLDGILALADPDIVLRSLLTEAERPLYHGHDGAVVIALDVTATGAGSGVPIDQTYCLGARVEAAKIVFFGFFRTEDDALEAVT
jgi:ketosteroid isomerase-like protein